MEAPRTNRDLENRKSPIRYRLISPDGKAYAAFRLKEGVKLSDITRANRGVGWDVEVVRS